MNVSSQPSKNWTSILSMWNTRFVTLGRSPGGSYHRRTTLDSEASDDDTMRDSDAPLYRRGMSRLTTGSPASCTPPSSSLGRAPMPVSVSGHPIHPLEFLP
ncbi:hypothetical protein GCM10010317_025310 [Streptomyces mirabilis]|nr:hypothetical protein GCM10010317_025310 [Streptomyces mirabilis]